MVIKIEDYEYYQLSHKLTMSGLMCGLLHPIEWWMNEYRTSLQIGPTKDYIILFIYGYRYFNDMYEAFSMEKPTKEKVLKWLGSHYSERHLFKEDFNDILKRAYLYKGEKIEEVDIR